MPPVIDPRPIRAAPPAAPPHAASALLADAAQRAIRYLDALGERPVGERPVGVPAEARRALQAFDGPWSAAPTDPAAVLATLDALGSPATMASAGPRASGHVIGGALPAALAAGVLALAWNQNAGETDASPAGAMLERVALRWTLDALGLPGDAAGGFVAGGTMANFTALAAARHALLARAGWDVEAHGLFGAPPLTVVVSDEVHVRLLKALALLGLGRERVVRVPTDAQGRLHAGALPPLDPHTLVCLQAGNVNTGAVDPLRAVTDAARAAGAWVHVDGAFGLWAAAAPRRAALVAAAADADSWAVAAHEWLHVPHHSGIAICRDGDALRAAMAVQAGYLALGSAREPSQHTPEPSRRARGIEVWAALASLGRDGLAELVEGRCTLAADLATRLSHAGAEVLNEVVLNQVLVRFGDDARTRAVIAAVQADGSCWCGGTTWRGRAAMRISVSSWATTSADVARSADAIVRAMDATQASAHRAS